MAQQPPIQDAWTRARDRFVEDLTEAEKRIYHKGSLEMIYYDASAAQKRHEEVSNSKHLVDKLQPLVSAIDQYAEALDVYSNAYPLALSPLWGSLRIVLHLAREFGTYFEKLLDMLEQIGQVIPRFRAYERLFPDNQRLVQLISIVYVDILSFCSDIKSHFRHGKRAAKINLKLLSKLTWKPVNAQFEHYMRKFKAHERTVEKEAKLAEMIESAESRALVLANRLQLEKEMRQLERQARLSALCVVSSKELHLKQRQICHEGTGLWALQSPQYLDWKTKKGYRALCFYDARSLDTREVFGSLLQQLILSGILPLAAQEDLLSRLRKDEDNDRRGTLAKALRSMILSHPVAFLVVDGLDECKGETQKYIIDFLNRFIESEASEIRVLVTCRDESQTLSAITHWPRILLSESAISDDLRRFVSSSVRSSIEKGDLKISDTSLEQEVVAVLATKAHGMFLWVYFQLIELCTAIAPSHIREALQALPDGLGDTYERILTRISSNIHWKIAQRIFYWLACAHRPLTLEEMQEAVAFELTDKTWDAGKIPHRASLLKICQGLAVQTPNSDTVQFAHYTVQQYLFTHDWSPVKVSDILKGRPENHYHCLSMKEARHFAAVICIIYLNFSDFETLITPRVQDTRFEKNSILGPGGPGAIAGSVGLGKPVFNAIYRVIGRSARPAALDIDYAKHLNLGQKSAGVPQGSKHEFLAYILENWPRHIDISGKIPKCQYQDLLVKILPFEFRPWGPNRHFGPYGCNFCSAGSPPGKQPRDLVLTSMIHWAAAEGTCDLLKILEASDLYDHLYHEKYSKETMILACRMGRTNVTEFLLDRDPVLCWDPSLLMIAASAGHVETLETLRKYRTEEFLTDLDNLLFKAATNGHASVVRYLLEYGVNSDFRDYLTDMTPLQSGIVNGHEDVVRALALSCFDVDDKDMSGATALHRSVQQHNLSMTVCLVECDASLESKDEEEKMPLDLAIVAGHEAVTSYLLAQPLYRTRMTSQTLLDDPHKTTMDWDILPHRKFLWAAAFGHVDSLEYLLDDDLANTLGARLNVIHIAASFGNLMAVRLLAWRSSPDLPTMSSCVPLHFAAHHGHHSTIRQLLGSKADPNSTTMHGWTPLHFAAKSGNRDCIELLCEMGADLNASTNPDQGGMTPVHFVGLKGRFNDLESQSIIPLIETLVHQGAELKKCNTAGETVYEVVAKTSGRRLHQLLTIERRQKRPQLWHLKRLMGNSEQLPKFDWTYPLSGLHVSELISRGTFNDHDVIYARHLLKIARQWLVQCLDQPSRRYKLESLVFLLEQAIVPSNANQKVIPSSEDSPDSLAILQPPSTPVQL